MRILVTGSKGFIGKNLCLRLSELKRYEVLEYTRTHSIALLPSLISKVDVVVHLAGENRPIDVQAFESVNAGMTLELCRAIKLSGRNIPVIFSSSTQVERDNPYGQSKLNAEKHLMGLAEETGNSVIAYRLPGVFGKWCRPNYNSVVATFCHNIARDEPIQINDVNVSVRLVYIDDVVAEFIDALDRSNDGYCNAEVKPEYVVTLGKLAEQIQAFQNCRESLVSERVGGGFLRALYATYVSYLPIEKFVYDVPKYDDERGVFVEMLKTPDAGQFSFFTAHPGVMRGSHYHHTKTEKFLVIRGKARFGFRHMITDETTVIFTSGDTPQIVETVPGWTHDVTNVGVDEMIVMLWANEIFDRNCPDTIACKV